ncbi:MAG TPA: NAD+ synthase [Polyangia bacterium]|jgi:NAD+ synthetase|nr:NAD+ synthase [Polyangia bacterium]
MSGLRITLAQLNPTVGDIAGNVAGMCRAAAAARARDAQLLVFPELSLTGYYPGDLLEEAAFLERVDAGLARLLEATRETPGLHWVVGAPVRNPGPGKPLQNALLLLRDGREVLRYAKQLLPTYNVFDEHRHFEPGPDVAKVLRIGAHQIGFLICEDGWNDTGSDYPINPFQRLADAAPDVVVSINASPSSRGKREQRHALFSAASQRRGFPIVYVNQIGGQDQLVFDGASFVATPTDGVVFEARRFEEDLVTLAFQDDGIRSGKGAPLPPVDPAGLSVMEFYRQQIILGLRDYARRCGFRKAVVGSSGGIDSALTLALAAAALGPENVVGVTMPSRFSSGGSVTDSADLCRNLGVPLLEHPIRSLTDTFADGFQTAFAQPLVGLPLENLQARIRGTILMEYSNAFGHLLLTTGNKSEISVGYCTLYGDTNGGLGLIGDLYKTEVFALSRHLNELAGRALIPTRILEKEPSAELAPGQRDTDSLPPYPVLDVILKQLIEGDRLGAEERDSVRVEFAGLAATPEGAALIARVRQMIARNEYKRRQAAPILRVRARAFGSGRQMPIAAVCP